MSNVIYLHDRKKSTPEPAPATHAATAVAADTSATNFRRDLDPRARYEMLRQRGVDELHDGRLDVAYEYFDQAYSVACDLADDCLCDRAFCNRAAVAIEIGSPGDSLEPLRQILTLHRDVENSGLAAYNIAQIYQLKKDFKKGLFYARIARNLFVQLGRNERLAAGYNRIGNLLLADSYFDEAVAEYEKALELFEPGPSIQRAILIENLGYCRVVQGRCDEGFHLLFESLRSLRRLGGHGFAVYPHLSLCYAYIERARPRHALRHGMRALALATTFRNQDCTKYAYYLLAQAAQLEGDPVAARDYLVQLQSEFYPQSPEIVDFLMVVDVRQVINIKA